MARKKQDITIHYEGRDKGKVFQITEMSSLQVERWAMRAVNALVRAGADVPDGLELAGMAAIVAIGIKNISKIPFEELDPLFAEMFGCLMLKPDPAHPEIVRHLVDGVGDGDDIQEVNTCLLLRQKILELHLGFSIAGGSPT